jgi:DNA modification methylase
MSESGDTKLIRGFIFACTDKTEKECFDRSLFGALTAYGPVVIRVRKGDLLFLHNLDSALLYGVFRAASDGSFNIESDAWGGKYPYQVRVMPIGERITLRQSEILDKLKVERSNPLLGKKLINLLDHFVSNRRSESLDDFTSEEDAKSFDEKSVKLINMEKEKIRKRIDEVDIAEDIPLVEPTTSWDFSKQSYGLTPKGDNKYPGVTPALIIYNLVWRYTNPGDFVVDPMCGSGTTIDVCNDEKRRVKGYDISPVRPDIVQNDARSIPLDDNSVDMIFVDSPYGDNVKYNDHLDDIGKISSETELFYTELEKVIKECHRVLKPEKVLGWLIGDQWVGGHFTPVGFKLYERLSKYFETVDTISVTRRGQTSHTGTWVNRARRFNFYLRGFKYLFVMRKSTGRQTDTEKARKVNWDQYREKRNRRKREGVKS